MSPDERCRWQNSVMPRPIEALVHRDALAANFAVARAAAAGARVWAVVKADAYGHGIANVYPALQGADGFALLDIAEAALLRELGWRGPVLLLSRPARACISGTLSTRRRRSTCSRR
jgi:alanine racemase